MRFDSPLYLILILLIFLGGKNKKSSSLPVANFSQFSRTRVFSLKVFIYEKINIIKKIVYLFLVIALARPQMDGQMIDSGQMGRDIMMTIDLSKSMDAVDFTKNGFHLTRIEILKGVVKDFVSEREGDRIGMVVFGQQALTLAPLTVDHSAIQSTISSLKTEMVGAATAIGDGIVVALKRFQKIQGKSKVMLLVSDGKDNYSTVKPTKAAEIAKSMGIKIYVIGIGKQGKADVEVDGPYGKILVPMDLEYDEAQLMEIANVTGGKYFNAQTTERLNEIYNEINQVELRKDKGVANYVYQEKYQVFLSVGLIMMILVILIELTYLKVVEI